MLTPTCHTPQLKKTLVKQFKEDLNKCGNLAAWLVVLVHCTAS